MSEKRELPEWAWISNTFRDLDTEDDFKWFLHLYNAFEELTYRIHEYKIKDRTCDCEEIVDYTRIYAFDNFYDGFKWITHYVNNECKQCRGDVTLTYESLKEVDEFLKLHDDWKKNEEEHRRELWKQEELKQLKRLLDKHGIPEDWKE